MHHTREPDDRKCHEGKGLIKGLKFCKMLIGQNKKMILNLQSLFLKSVYIQGKHTDIFELLELLEKFCVSSVEVYIKRLKKNSKYLETF